MNLWLTGATWDNPTPPIQALKYAPADRAPERAARTPENWTWDFLGYSYDFTVQFTLGRPPAISI